ncbi:MAG: hypothetical protein K5891_11150 [Lachnospiraceae bacterium]|nr:hypothetical protein [Lachnospiraceae bacterium]
MDTSNMQPVQVRRRPGEQLATASLIFGVLSVLLIITGFFGIAAGALGLLFGFLSLRNGQEPTSLQRAGLISSGIGFGLSLLLIMYSVYLVLNDPTILESVNQMYNALYGTSDDWNTYLQMLQDMSK